MKIFGNYFSGYETGFINKFLDGINYVLTPIRMEHGKPLIQRWEYFYYIHIEHPIRFTSQLHINRKLNCLFGNHWWGANYSNIPITTCMWCDIVNIYGRNTKLRSILKPFVNFILLVLLLLYFPIYRYKIDSSFTKSGRINRVFMRKQKWIY